MRWLMIGLLVSLGALLFAAAGMARHIWLRRTKLDRKPVVSARQPLQAGPNSKPDSKLNPIQNPAEETDL